MKSWERIKKVMDYLGLNKNSFSKEIGLSNNVTIGRIVREKRPASAKTIKKITDRFPMISYDWLLSGVGNMLTKSHDKEMPEINLENSDEEFSNSKILDSDLKVFSLENYNKLITAFADLVNTNKELVKTNEKLVQMLGKEIDQRLKKA